MALLFAGLVALAITGGSRASATAAARGEMSDRAVSTVHRWFGDAGGWTVKVTDSAFVVGSYHGGWSRGSSLNAVFAALGNPRTCIARAMRGYPTIRANWPDLGVSVTAGLDDPGGLSLARGKTGCTEPSVMTDVYFTLTGSRWHTNRGLRLGDSLTRLRSLYPLATHRGAHYWLHARQAATGLTGDLIANVSNGRIVSFNVLGATSE